MPNISACRVLACTRVGGRPSPPLPIRRAETARGLRAIGPKPPSPAFRASLAPFAGSPRQEPLAEKVEAGSVEDSIEATEALAMPWGLGARQAPSLELPTPVITGGGNRPERQSDRGASWASSPPLEAREATGGAAAHRQAKPRHGPHLPASRKPARLAKPATGKGEWTSRFRRTRGCV